MPVTSPTTRSSGRGATRRPFLAVAVLSALVVQLLLSGAAPASAAVAPGTVISGFKDQFHLQTGAGQQALVGALTLPAGSYSITAKLYTTVPLPAGLNATIKCILHTQEGDFDQTLVNHDAITASVPVALNVVHTYRGTGTVVLTCGHEVSRGETYLRFVKITAMSATTLTNVRLA